MANICQHKCAKILCHSYIGLQPLHPGQEVALEQLGIDRAITSHKSVVARDAVPIGQETAKKRLMLAAQQADLYEVVGAGIGAQSMSNRISSSE